jgi:hypothetical protein
VEQQERTWLMKAKADVALQISDEELAERYQKDVANIASVLMAIANKGSEDNGG